MNFVLSRELEELRADAKNFTQSELDPFVEEVETTDDVPRSIIDKLKAKGYFGLTIPKEYGGCGFGRLATAVIQIELAKSHVAFEDLIAINNGLGSHSIILAGSDALKQKYLPPLARGDIISSFALTEPNAGSDAGGILTTAKRQGDCFVLNGLKHYITNAPFADIFIVMAVTDDKLRARGGITAFLVEKGTPGLSIGSIHHKMGFHGSHQSEVILEDVSIPVENVIGDLGQGFVIAMKTVDQGRIGVTAIALGIAEKVLELSIEHAKKTMRSGKPIAELQSIQWTLADMAMEIYATKMMMYHAATKVDSGDSAQLEAAMCKLYGSEMVQRVIEKAFEIFGNQGYVKGSTIERFCRDARLLSIFDGTAEIHRIVIGRGLFRRSWVV